MLRGAFGTCQPVNFPICVAQIANSKSRLCHFADTLPSLSARALATQNLALLRQKVFLMTPRRAVLISKLAAVAIAMGVRRLLWIVNVLYIGIVAWNLITISGIVLRAK